MATFALLIWPLVSMVLFSVLGRNRGLIWSVVVGFLFLPEVWSFDFPVLPPFGKHETISLGVLLGALITRAKAEPLPEADSWAKGVMTALVALLFLAPFLTMLTNRDSYMIGPLWFPAIGLWDVLATIFSWLVSLVPFFLARRFLHNPDMHRELLKAMVIMGLFYALLALYELRMSPQLNNMVYGYFPHQWLQHIRGGGWRPLVFLAHGLELGFFLLTAVLAGIGLVRATARESRALYLIAALALFVVLALSRNLGALAICLLLAPAAFMLTPKMHVRIAVIVAILFAAYPLTRHVYIQPLLTVAEKVSTERFRSLHFRFMNEDMFVARAAERPVAGWGSWGRWRVYDDAGRDLTVSDGIWIIQLGAWGWVGFTGLFGLLMAPLVLMRRAARHQPLGPATSVLALMVAANLIYMIPNSTLTPICWLVAGALAGYVQFAPGPAAEGRLLPRYTRFGSTNRPGPVRLSRFN